MPLSNCHDLLVVYGLVEMGEKPKVLRFIAGDAELPSGLLNQVQSTEWGVDLCKFMVRRPNWKSSKYIHEVLLVNGGSRACYISNHGS